MQEQILLAQCSERTPMAVENLCEIYGHSAYAFLICALLGDETQAKSVLVQSFTQGIRTISPYQEKTLFQLKLFRAIVQSIREFPKAPHPPRMRGKRIAITSKDVTTRRYEFIFNTLSEMSLVDRILILLRDQTDLSYEEIAHVLKIPVSTVKEQLQSARGQFRDVLEKVMKGQIFPGHGMR